MPISDTISCVGSAVTGVTRRIGQRAVIRTSARTARWRSTMFRAITSAISSTIARLTEHGIADRLVEHLGEARHVDALLPAREVDGALDLGRHHRLGLAAPDPDRLLDMRVTPARESASSTGGADACMSATR